jgi:hypothetical protein
MPSAEIPPIVQAVKELPNPAVTNTLGAVRAIVSLLARVESFYNCFSLADVPLHSQPQFSKVIPVFPTLRASAQVDFPLGLDLLEVSFPKQRRSFCCVKVVGERVRSSSTLVSCETLPMSESK